MVGLPVVGLARLERLHRRRVVDHGRANRGRALGILAAAAKPASTRDARTMIRDRRAFGVIQNAAAWRGTRAVGADDARRRALACGAREGVAAGLDDHLAGLRVAKVPGVAVAEGIRGDARLAVARHAPGRVVATRRIVQVGKPGGLARRGRARLCH